MRKHSRCGFTLIEITVALVIVGVLAAMAFPNYMLYVSKMKAREGEQLLISLLGAQKRYLSDTGAYGTDLDDLDIELRTPQYFDIATVQIFDPLAMPNNEAVQLAARNDVGFQYVFGLVIDRDGNIACTPGSADVVTYCQRLGFAPPF